MTKELTPLSEIESSGVDVNIAIEQANQMTDVLRQMGIKEATFDSGAYFNHNERTETTTVATEGILITKGTHCTNIILRHEGSDEKETLEEVSNMTLTQEALGSFSKKSQPWVSGKLTDNENNS